MYGTITILTALFERFEAAINREEAVAKNQEELAGVIFETFLDDDGSIQDIAYSGEIIFSLSRRRRLKNPRVNEKKN